MRAVYIGGFANGEASAAGVAKALEADYSHVEAFTFSQAMRQPDVIKKAVQRAHALTHSAGMLALKDASPRSIQAVAAPLETPIIEFPYRTIHKTINMHSGRRNSDDIAAVKRYERDSARELIRHPVANLRHLGAIAAFDAVTGAVAAAEAGVKTSLVYHDRDEYFDLSAHYELSAIAAGVAVVRTPGIHDELVLRPAQTLAAIAAQEQRRS